MTTVTYPATDLLDEVDRKIDAGMCASCGKNCADSVCDDCERVVMDKPQSWGGGD